MRAARGHLIRARQAATAISAGEHYQVAARWFHFATLGPNRDRALAAAEADAAMGRALDMMEPRARRIEEPGFAGWLGGPVDAEATVVVVPGLDSSKEEFHDVINALLRRGLTVFAMDGPGQGVLAATTTVRADYHHVIGQVIDALGTESVGLVGLSLGGYYVAESAARETRVAAAATVSGPFRLDWGGLPPPVREILIRRAAGPPGTTRAVPAHPSRRPPARQRPPRLAGSTRRLAYRSTHLTRFIVKTALITGGTSSR
ncbi:alpha/beta fold hydrolase [Nonomuraea sp. NPDC046570]|uniref:alpha/beta hydrolase n=1 Tax=Nonomuraea sp. NPDC046570 TaxID=3155255 RepID=UPI0033C585FA